jgi:hypothetical protein
MPAATMPRLAALPKPDRPSPGAPWRKRKNESAFPESVPRTTLTFMEVSIAFQTLLAGSQRDIPAYERIERYVRVGISNNAEPHFVATWLRLCVAQWHLRKAIY